MATLNSIRPIPGLTEGDLARFWVKVETHPDWWECWSWLAATTEDGYGRIRIGGGVYLAHRVAYAICRSEPGPLVLDHLCGRGADGCVNPWHLVAVTQAENVRRVAALRVACKRGHPVTVAGRCKECRRDHEAQRRSTVRNTALSRGAVRERDATKGT